MRKLERVEQTVNGVTFSCLRYVQPQAPTPAHLQPGAISIWLRTGRYGQTLPRAVRIVDHKGQWVNVVERDGTPHRVKAHNIAKVAEARFWMHERAADEAEQWAAEVRNNG